jgi:hypothetical protein
MWQQQQRMIEQKFAALLHLSSPPICVTISVILVQICIIYLGDCGGV